MLVCLGDEAPPELAVGEHANRDLGERVRVARGKAKSDLLVRHDLAETAGIGHQAGTSGSHRLERDEAERLIYRWYHGQVGDPVERVEDVVANPAQEGSMGVEPELGR